MDGNVHWPMAVLKTLFNLFFILSSTIQNCGQQTFTFPLNLIFALAVIVWISIENIIEIYKCITGCHVQRLFQLVSDNTYDICACAYRGCCVLFALQFYKLSCYTAILFIYNNKSISNTSATLVICHIPISWDFYFKLNV